MALAYSSPFWLGANLVPQLSADVLTCVLYTTDCALTAPAHPIQPTEATIQTFYTTSSNPDTRPNCAVRVAMDPNKPEVLPVTKEDVDALQSILRSDDSIQTKGEKVDAVKSSIKKHNLDISYENDESDEYITKLFEAFRVASSNQHGSLANKGLSALKHYHTRLYLQYIQKLQDPKLANVIRDEMKTTLPLLVNRMGDQKKDVRGPAVQALATMHKVLPADVEHHVRVAMADNKNPRAKEASMQWLVQMNREQGLKFKAYVETFVPLVVAADPGVRDTAKTTVIELYRGAPPAARSELFAILDRIGARSTFKQDIEKALAPRSTTPAPDEDAPADLPRPASRPGLSASVSSISTFSERPITPLPDTRTEKVEPSYLNTTREIDDMFAQMHAFFEGNESEKNWRDRETSVKRLRRLMAGNAVSDFHDPFLGGLRGLLHGIIKAVVSLRTSLSKEGCALVQDIAVNYGSGMDPMVELLMQTLVKLSGSTKKIAQQQANVCIDTMISRVTYTNRILTHVTDPLTKKEETNVQRRVFAAEWLRTLLRKEAHHKSHLEHNGGLEVIEHSIEKCLGDADPKVREKMRGTFWTYSDVWPARAEEYVVPFVPLQMR